MDCRNNLFVQWRTGRLLSWRVLVGLLRSTHLWNQWDGKKITCGLTAYCICGDCGWDAKLWFLLWWSIALYNFTSKSSLSIFHPISLWYWSCFSNWSTVNPENSDWPYCPGLGDWANCWGGGEYTGAPYCCCGYIGAPCCGYPCCWGGYPCCWGCGDWGCGDPVLESSNPSLERVVPGANAMASKDNHNALTNPLASATWVAKVPTPTAAESPPVMNPTTTPFAFKKIEPFSLPKPLAILHNNEEWPSLHHLVQQ